MIYFALKLFLSLCVLYIWNWRTKRKSALCEENFYFGGSMVRSCATMVLTFFVDSWDITSKNIDAMIDDMSDASGLLIVWASTILFFILSWIAMFVILISFEVNYSGQSVSARSRRIAMLFIGNMLGVASFYVMHVSLSVLYR